MSLIDLILLIFLGGFVLAGFWFGVIHMVGATLGVIFGGFVAGRYYDDLAKFLAKYIPLSLSGVEVLAFIIIFILVNRVVGVILTLIDKLVQLVKFIPLLGTANRLLGAVFGFVEGALVLGLVITFASRLPWGGQFITDLTTSEVARTLNGIGSKLLLLLPLALQNIKSLFGK